MKPTLLFAMLSMVLAVPGASAATELETLRARCIEQERQIRHLEEQLGKARGGTSAQTTAVANASTPGAPTVHTVRPGESMERIARRNGCSVPALAKANGLKISAVIHPGQKLKLPGAPVAKAPAATPTAVSRPADQTLAGKTHKIRAGETYSSISRKYRMSTQALIAANPEVKPTALRPGQVIRLSASAAPTAPQPLQSTAVAAAPVRQSRPLPEVAPASAPAPAPAIAPQPKPAPAPAQTSTPVSALATAAKAPTAEAQTAPANSPPAPTPSPANNTEKKIRSVTIEGEMSYGEFAAKHGTDTARLNDLNGLDLTTATVLAKGSELYVPAQP